MLKIYLDHSFLTIGTKLRKIQGIAKKILKEKISKVALVGNIHSNFLMGISIYLHSLQIQTEVSCYSYSERSSLNSEILRRFASKLHFFSTRRDAFENWNQKLSQGIFPVPEFGLCVEAEAGLMSLWEKMGHNLFHVKQIFLDIGSGLTFVSLLHFLEKFPKNERPELVGICIGNKKEKLQLELQNLYERLFSQNWKGEGILLVSPIENTKFGYFDDLEKRTILKFACKHNLYLEPIYSAKSICAIQKLVDTEKINGEGIYFHQGGTANHWKLLLDFSKSTL